MVRAACSWLSKFHFNISFQWYPLFLFIMSTTLPLKLYFPIGSAWWLARLCQQFFSFWSPLAPLAFHVNVSCCSYCKLLKSCSFFLKKMSNRTAPPMSHPTQSLWRKWMVFSGRQSLLMMKHFMASTNAAFLMFWLESSWPRISYKSLIHITTRQYMAHLDAQSCE